MQKRILSLLVDNTAGVLSRIAGLFSRRGYNIDRDKILFCITHLLSSYCSLHLQQCFQYFNLVNNSIVKLFACLSL